jgi:hypothetical protein
MADEAWSPLSPAGSGGFDAGFDSSGLARMRTYSTEHEEEQVCIR